MLLIYYQKNPKSQALLKILIISVTAKTTILYYYGTKVSLPLQEYEILSISRFKNEKCKVAYLFAPDALALVKFLIMHIIYT